MESPAPIGEVIEALRKHHGRLAPPPTSTPFEQVLWDTASYLVPDETRLAVFRRLEAEVGTRPRDILAAKPARLVEALRGGGMRPDMRAQRIRAAARVAAQMGDLDALARRPLKEATQAFARFPAIGVPGAEKILLFAGAHAVPALESNGLRALARLGYGDPRRSYAALYRSVREALAAQGKRTAAFWTQAHLLLRRHGQETCRRSVPACKVCVLRSLCPWPARAERRG